MTALCWRSRVAGKRSQMGFYFKIAPGVKIRATRRGMRASVGPRAARVHFGAGGTGVSTGAGPVSLYHSVGGGHGRRRAAEPSRTSIAAYERQLRQAEKLQQAEELRDAFVGIMNLHRQYLATVIAPVAPSPEPVDQTTIKRRHDQEALRGLNVFQRSARALARQQAADAATREIEMETARRQAERAELQRHLDEQWNRLLANDPDVVFATLTEAFEDNEAPAAVAGVHDGEASVVLMAPDADAVPERMPRLTEAGNLSLRKLTKTEGNSFYGLLMCGYILVTVREALAVALGLKSVRVAVVRRTPPNAYGVQSVECLLAAVFTRDALQGIQWQSADAGMIVNDASAELRIQQGSAEEFQPLDLSNEPSLTALLRAVDLDDLGEVARKEESDEARDLAYSTFADLGLRNLAHDRLGVIRAEAEAYGCGPGAGEASGADGARPRDPTVPHIESHAAAPSSNPPPWRPRPGGTVRDYTVVTNDDGGTDTACSFVPDDGGEPVQLLSRDTVIPEMGEYARGIMRDHEELTIKASAAAMIKAEQNVFRVINEMAPAQRALLYAQGFDLHEDCGWTWTPDYKLVKAAPGLID